ncbi:hypothetical protein [Vibrio caribbeanicus]|uniref:hypothetical protein n=1 Tax=Vibrio caribbeanicus TaxID=701175 RepID=UPI0030DD585F
MLKKTTILLLLLVICEYSFAKCTLHKLNDGDNKETFGDKFTMYVEDTNFTPKHEKEYYSVTYKITEVSPYLGNIDDFMVRRANGQLAKDKNKFGFNTRMTVQIVRKETLKPINFEKLPAGEHFVIVEFTAQCR